MTRGQVAKRLGKNVSWVRRREGTLLHPWLEGGVHCFAVEEVKAVARQMEESDTAAREVTEENPDLIRLFEGHSDYGEPCSVEGIAARMEMPPVGVRGAHRSWRAQRLETGLSSRPLLSRAKFEQEERRQEKKLDRDYASRMTAFEAESEAQRKQAEKASKDLAAKWDMEREKRDTERESYMKRLLAPRTPSKLNTEGESDWAGPLVALLAMFLLAKKDRQ